MNASHSLQILLKLETCVPMSYVTLEMLPKCANIHAVSSQLYASISLGIA